MAIMQDIEKVVVTHVLLNVVFLNTLAFMNDFFAAFGRCKL